MLYVRLRRGVVKEGTKVEDLAFEEILGQLMDAVCRAVVEVDELFL